MRSTGGSRGQHSPLPEPGVLPVQVRQGRLKPVALPAQLGHLLLGLLPRVAELLLELDALVDDVLLLGLQVPNPLLKAAVVGQELGRLAGLLPPLAQLPTGQQAPPRCLDPDRSPPPPGEIGPAAVHAPGRLDGQRRPLPPQALHLAPRKQPPPGGLDGHDGGAGTAEAAALAEHAEPRLDPQSRPLPSPPLKLAARQQAPHVPLQQQRCSHRPLEVASAEPAPDVRLDPNCRLVAPGAPLLVQQGTLARPQEDQRGPQLVVLEASRPQDGIGRLPLG